MNKFFSALAIVGIAVVPSFISGCTKDGLPRNSRGETPKEQAHREMEERTGLKIGESPGAAMAKKQEALWALYKEERKTILSRTSYQVFDRNMKNRNAQVTYLEMNYNFRGTFSSMRLMRDSLTWDGKGWQVISSSPIDNTQPWSSNLEAIQKKIQPAKLIGMSPKQVAAVLGKSKGYRQVGGGGTIPAEECRYSPLPHTGVKVWYGNKMANRVDITFRAGKTLPDLSPSEVARAFNIDEDEKGKSPTSFVGIPKTPFTHIRLTLRYAGTFPFYTLSFGAPGAHYS